MTRDGSIIGFLRDRIDELEQAAEQAQAAERAASGTPDKPHDPTSWISVVIEDCHAKRAILNLIELPPNQSSAENPGPDDDAGWALQRVLRLMAEPWSMHRHYRKVWRP